MCSNDNKDHQFTENQASPLGLQKSLHVGAHLSQTNLSWTVLIKECALTAHQASFHAALILQFCAEEQARFWTPSIEVDIMQCPLNSLSCHGNSVDNACNKTEALVCLYLKVAHCLWCYFRMSMSLCF